MFSWFPTWITGWKMAPFTELENTCSKAYKWDRLVFQLLNSLLNMLNLVSWEYLNELVWESFKYVYLEFRGEIQSRNLDFCITSI